LFFELAKIVASGRLGLAEIGVRVHCLALGGVDLASSAGTMTMNVLNAVAQFERDLLIERTQSGLKRAKAGGGEFSAAHQSSPKSRNEMHVLSCRQG
jgi:putative DNA-invertase from lambdoid prophage Rac